MYFPQIIWIKHKKLFTTPSKGLIGIISIFVIIDNIKSQLWKKQKPIASTGDFFLNSGSLFK